MKKSEIATLIANHRILVCCGSGGVGKTTTSAVLALSAAIEGKKAVVITIDPAKRLATSLGLKELSNTPTDLSENVNKVLEKLGAPKLQGSFFAVMPDTTQTFEKFVRSMAGADEGLAKRVLRTSIYKIFARDFSGANEYMAMEKLYELYSESAYDLVVLDTPPSANTTIFLEAPKRLAEFFDDSIMKWIIAPGSKIMAAGLKKLMAALEKLTGHGFISELLEFTTALFELRSQFMDNLGKVSSLLHQSDVNFLMVTSPERLSKNDTQEFVTLLKEQKYRFWGFVVNRVLSKKLNIDLSKPLSTDRFAQELLKLSPTPSEDDLKILRQNMEHLLPTLQVEKEAELFLGSFQGKVALVAEQSSDVHSIEALVSVCKQLSLEDQVSLT